MGSPLDLCTFGSYFGRDAIGEKGPDQKKSLIDTLKIIKLEAPAAATAKSSKELTDALEAAKAATAEYGVTSSEARLAWETYEGTRIIQILGWINCGGFKCIPYPLTFTCMVSMPLTEIASNSNENAIGVNLLEECSVESGIEACRAMEELQRVLPVLMAISKK